MIGDFVIAMHGWILVVGARGDKAEVSKNNGKVWVGSSLAAVRRSVPIAVTVLAPVSQNSDIVWLRGHG